MLPGFHRREPLQSEKANRLASAFETSRMEALLGAHFITLVHDRAATLSSRSSRPIAIGRRSQSTSRLPQPHCRIASGLDVVASSRRLGLAVDRSGVAIGRQAGTGMNATTPD